MAAIDPDASPEFSEEFSEDKKPRATLKIIRAPDGMFEDDDDESDDEDYEDVDSDEEEDSDDESNGGPSDPVKAKMAKKAAALKELEDAMDEDESDDGDDEDLKAAISKLIKGKGKAFDDEEDSDDDDGEGLELEEVVVCTLDPERVCFLFILGRVEVLIDCVDLPAAHRLCRRGERAHLLQGYWHPHRLPHR